MRDAIAKMLDKGVIEPSISSWSSPIVLVEKKNGEYWFCIDYRKLNAITKKDRYPLPRIDDLLEKIKGADFFSTFDLASGFWQIPIYPPHKEKTACLPCPVHSQTSDGHFADIRLLFEFVRAYNLKLGLKKCVFFRKKIGFLCHIVSKEGI